MSNEMKPKITETYVVEQIKSFLINKSNGR